MAFTSIVNLLNIVHIEHISTLGCIHWAGNKAPDYILFDVHPLHQARPTQ